MFNEFSTKRCSVFQIVRKVGIIVISFLTTPLAIMAQQPEEKSPEIVISDVPKSTDAAVAVPDSLRKSVSVDFVNKPLTEMVTWLRQQTGLNVIIDRQSLNASRLLPSEPVDDRLVDEPIYILLDRLKYRNLTWRMQDKGIRIYAAEDKGQWVTAQYNVGDLFDKKYKSDDLESAIMETIAPGSWERRGGRAELNVLGDVLFVRQSHANHRLLQGLLHTLRNHGRRTIVDDPPRHELIRQQLNQVISFEFTETPLATAVDELVKKTQIDMRLDRTALAKISFHERTPVTLQVLDQTASSALDIFTANCILAWKISDGVIWITSREAYESSKRIAVYDVRDLCQNEIESEALANAIATQSSWKDEPDEGSISFPRFDTMVILNSEKVLDEVLALLENYRSALRDSKRRVNPDTDPKTVITRYYRMPTDVAEQLSKLLPQLIETASWKLNDAKSAGTILVIKSWREDIEKSRENAALQHPAEFSVLRIEQTRKVQDQLPELFNRIRRGDNLGGSGGMGGMGGSFGGGMFRLIDGQ